MIIWMDEWNFQDGLKTNINYFKNWPFIFPSIDLSDDIHVKVKGQAQSPQ